MNTHRLKTIHIEDTPIYLVLDSNDTVVFSALTRRTARAYIREHTTSSTPSASVKDWFVLGVLLTCAYLALRALWVIVVGLVVR